MLDYKLPDIEVKSIMPHKGRVRRISGANSEKRPCDTIQIKISGSMAYLGENRHAERVHSALK